MNKDDRLKGLLAKKKVSKVLNGLIKKSINAYWKSSNKHLERLKKKLFINKKKNNAHLLVFLYLNHNNSTLKTIGQLMNKRQYDESLVLMRVVLERSGLVLKSLIECLNTEQIEKQKSSECVGYLKKFFDVVKYSILMIFWQRQRMQLFLKQFFINNFCCVSGYLYWRKCPADSYAHHFLIF